MPDKEHEKHLSNIAADITIAVVILLVSLAVLGVYINEVVDLYRRILDWFYSENWIKINSTFTIIFSLINAALFGFIVFTLRRFTRLDEIIAAKGAIKGKAPETPEKEVNEQWQHIRGLANSQNPSDWNMAVLRADALLDDILQHLGYEGLTMADRLKIVDPTKLSSLDNVWSAHRLRNMIAHDPLEQHTRETIIHALRSYEQALRELDLLAEDK